MDASVAVSLLLHCQWGFCVAVSSSAAEALSAIALLSKNPVFSEDRLLASQTAASNLLSLAAQIALEVEPITKHRF